MSFFKQEQNDDLHPHARACERCGIVVPSDDSLCRVPGFDSRVCGPCFIDLVRDGGEAIRRDNDTLKVLIGMQQVEFLARSGNMDHAVSLLREIFNNEKKNIQLPIKGNPE